MIRNTLVRKAGFTVCLVIASIALIVAGILSVSYYRLWQASKLLVAVRDFHPGSTSESQARSALESFAPYRIQEEGQSNSRVNEIEIAVQNSPPFPWTRFSVDIQFAEGLVSDIKLTEVQVDHPGYPHPTGASVTMYSNRLSSLPAGFSGYSEAMHHSGGVDSRGNWSGFACCYERVVQLDERASPTQVARSLNFQLHCMTSFVRCKDDRQILP